MGLLEKRRFRNFIIFCNNFDPNDTKTHNGGDGQVLQAFFCHIISPYASMPGIPSGMDPAKTLMSAVFEKYGLDQNTRDFTGHAIALYRDDE